MARNGWKVLAEVTRVAPALHRVSPVLVILGGIPSRRCIAVGPQFRLTRGSNWKRGAIEEFLARIPRRTAVSPLGAGAVPRNWSPRLLW